MTLRDPPRQSDAAVSVSADRQARLDQAAHWRAQLDEDPTLADAAIYVSWMSDASNRTAMVDLDRVWKAVEDHATAPEIMAIRSAALADVRRAAGRRWQPFKFPWRSIAASVLIVGALAAGAYVYLGTPVSYSTAVGERRVVTLEDGSRLSLDSDTKVSVRYSHGARDLTLERGRARFRVAHDQTRPFTVKAGTETVLAVGTSFNVDRLAQKVIVTLLEGRVSVTAAQSNHTSSSAPEPGGKARSTTLKTGEQLVAISGGSITVTPANLQAATSWESGRLEFYDEPLSEAVAHMSRYSAQQLQIDPAIADLRISGVFDAGDVASFVDAVTSYFAIDAFTIEGRMILRPRTAT